MAKKQNRQPNAAAKSSKKEQICKIHTNLVNSQGVVVLSDPTFGEFAAGNRYLYKNSDSQNFDIFITEKVTNADSGGHTWFKCIINGEEYPYQDIQELKKLVGCTYTRKYGNKGERGFPTSVTQKEEYIKNWTAKNLQKIEELERIFSSYNVAEQFNFEPLKQYTIQVTAAHCENLYLSYLEEEKVKREERREIKVSKKADALKNLSVQELQLLIVKMQEEVGKRVQ